MPRLLEYVPRRSLQDVAARPGAGRETVARIYLAAMRRHDRRAALLHWSHGRWCETPDWRLDRQVIRLGLFLRQRAGLAPGDRVAILSRLRPEWVLAELASLVQGAVPVSVNPDLSGATLAAALAAAAPRVAFVSGPDVLGRLEAARSQVPGLERIVAFDGASPGEGVSLLSEALDLGGTLDTAERATAFRAQAREVDASAPALGYLHPEASACELLSHGELAARLRSLWSREPARPGDVAYVAGGEATLSARTMLLAFVGDGHTATVLGTAGREAEEVAPLAPHRLVVAPGFLEAALSRMDAGAAGGRGLRGWLGGALRRAARRPDARAVLGGRARWLHVTAELSVQAFRRWSIIATIDRGL